VKCGLKTLDGRRIRCLLPFLIPVAAIVVALLASCERSPAPLRAAAPSVYPCEPAAAAPRLDGDLKEWEGTLWIPFGTLEQANWKGGWNGTADLSGFVALRWDRRWLYGAARVTDDRVRSTTGEHVDKSDHIALRLWVRHEEKHVIAPTAFAARDELVALTRREEGRLSLIARAHKLIDLGLGFAADGGVYTASIRPGEAWPRGGRLTDGWSAAPEEANSGAARRPGDGTSLLSVPIFTRVPLRLRLRAEAPVAVAEPIVEVRFNDRDLAVFPADATWTGTRTFSVDLPAGARRTGANALRLRFPQADAAGVESGALRYPAFLEFRFEPADQTRGQAPPFILADLDADGSAEVVFAIPPLDSGSAPGVAQWLAAIDFQDPWAGLHRLTHAVGPQFIAADLDGDGADAVLVRDGDGMIACGWENDSPTSTRLAAPIIAGNAVMAAARLDGIAGDEIVIADGATLTVYRATTDRLAPHCRTDLPAPCTALLSGSFLRRRPESICAILRKKDGYAAAVFSLNDEGEFAMSRRLDLGPSVLEATSGDLDGDGLDELAVLVSRGGGESIVRVFAFDHRQPRRVVLPGTVLGLRCANILGLSAGHRPLPGEPSCPTFAFRKTDGGDRSSWVHVPGSVTAAVKTVRGYDLEFRIPWTALTEPRAGAEIKCAIRIADRDAGGGCAWPTRGDGAIRLLAAALPRSAPLKPEFVRSLIAVGVPTSYALKGDAVEFTVLRGADPPLVPEIARLRVRDEEEAIEATASGGASAEEPGVQRWRTGHINLADGRLHVEALAAGTDEPVARTSWSCRTQEYRQLRRRFEGIWTRLGEQVGTSSRELLPTLLARADYQKRRIAAVPGAAARPDPKEFNAGLWTLDDAIEAAASGEDPLPEERGRLLRARYSPVDGSAQPYGLFVPEDYDPAESLPLVVSLHGAGYNPFHGYPPPAIPGCIVLSPHGRDWTDYMYLGERAVIGAIREVVRQYSIDPDRIYLIGSSMGGTGSWHLARRFPDMFAGIAPAAGNSDFRVWDRYWRLPEQTATGPMANLRGRLKADLSPVTWAANIAPVPVLNLHGVRDRVVYVEHSRHIVEAIRAAGGVAVYRELPESGHGVPGSARRDRLLWLLSQQRTRMPRRVRYRTETAPAGAFWAGILRKTSRLRPAAIDAGFVGPNEIEINAENVAAAALDFRGWRLRPGRAWRNALADPSLEADDIGRPGAAWEARGVAVTREEPARHGRRTLRLCADGAGERPELAQYTREAAVRTGERWSFGLWVKAGGAAPEESFLEIRARDESEPTERVLRAVPFVASNHWQYVAVDAAVDVAEPVRLAFAIVLAAGASPGEIICDSAWATPGGGLPAFDVNHDAVCGLQSYPTPSGRWEWRPVNFVPDGSFADLNANARTTGFHRWLARGARLRPTSDPLFGDSAAELTLDEDAAGAVLESETFALPKGKPLSAGVWARSETGTARLTLILDGGTGDLHAAESLALKDHWQHCGLSLPALAKAYPRARVLLQFDGDVARCTIDGVYVMPTGNVPGSVRAPSDPRLLDPARPVRVVFNGSTVHDAVLPRDRRVKIGEPGRPQPLGPIERAFLEPFLVVYGTQGSHRGRDMARRAAEEFLADWEFRYHHPCRIKPDAELTQSDLRDYNLVLFGDPQVNSITAKINDRLPVRFEDDRIVAGGRNFFGPDLGLHLIAANPLNPQRSVVVLAGTTWMGMFQINKRFGNWFGWRIYENRKWYDFAVFDERSLGPESFLAFGFFDDRGRLAPETTWFGDEGIRAQIPPRSVPVLRRAPRIFAEFHLSDLLPARVFQRMGVVRFDRSYEGNPIRLGGRRFRKGLGVQAAGSKVEFDLEGQFSRLTATAGIDIEGRTRVPFDRARAERVQFRILGDGRLLAESRVLRWNSPPAELLADVSDVQQVTLEVVPRGGRTWLYGSASWGDLKLERIPRRTVATEAELPPVGRP